MDAEQMNLYEVIPDDDPLYISISKMDRGENFTHGPYEISLNEFGIYEIATESIHEAINDPKACYDFVIKDL